MFRSRPESQSHLSLTSKKRPRQEAHTIRNIGGTPRHFFVPNLAVLPPTTRSCLPQSSLIPPSCHHQHPLFRALSFRIPSFRTHSFRIPSYRSPFFMPLFTFFLTPYQSFHPSSYRWPSFLPPIYSSLIPFALLTFALLLSPFFLTQTILSPIFL